MISVQKTACLGRTSQMPPQIIRLKTVSACCDGDRLQTCWAVVKKNQKKQKTNWHCTSVRQETPGDLGKAESPLQLSSDRTRCMALGKSISLLFTGMASIMGSKGLFDQVPRRQRYRQKRTEAGARCSRTHNRSIPLPWEVREGFLKEGSPKRTWAVSNSWVGRAAQVSGGLSDLCFWCQTQHLQTP